MIKYIAYCRKSTDEKDKQVASINQQIAELKEFAERENLEIVEFLTEAQTAKIPGRPVFNNLVKLIEKGFANGIVSWNPDRLARNSIDGGRIIYLLDLGKLESLKFPTHWFENTPQGRFMLSIAFGQAKYYVDNLSQNVQRGLRYKIKRGIWPARAPWGYRNDRNTRGIVIHPHEASVIRKAFELYAKGTYSLYDVGQFFYENGIKNRLTGGPPNDSNLRRILMRPLYYGGMVFKGELYEGIHEPIVSKSLFDQVQKIVKQRGWYHQHKSKRYDFAFTGFIKCGYCGCSITAENRPFYFPRTHHSVSYRYYHCTKKRLPCLQKGYTREEVLEKQFREITQSVSMSQQWADKMLELLENDAQTEKQQAKQELENLTVELTDIEKKLDRLLEAYLETIVETENYKQKKNQLMEKQSILKETISRLKEGNPFWIETMKEFIQSAQECAKIARAENNGHLLSQMAKKVGSKYFLKDHRIEFSLLPPYKALAASGGAASATEPSDRILAFGQSKYYVDNLSENVKRGLRQKLRNGVWPAKAPYGYLNNPKTRGIDVDPEKSKAIKRAFEMFAEGNHTFTDIAKYLHKFDLRRKNGKPLHINEIRQILCNKFYIGIMFYNGEYHDGNHKCFISKELFQKTQEEIQRRSKHFRKSHRFPFLGLVKCSECGAAITAEQHIKFYKTTNRTVTYIYYRCTKKLGPCSQVPITSFEMEEQMRKVISDVILPQSWADQWMKFLERDELSEKQSSETVIQNLKTEIQNVDRKQNMLLDSYLDSVVEPETYKRKKNEMFETKLKLQEEIDKVEDTGSSWLEPMREFINVAINCDKIARAKKNPDELAFFAKRVGSNFLLTNRQLTADFGRGFATLCATRTAQSFPMRSPSLSFCVAIAERSSNLF